MPEPISELLDAWRAQQRRRWASGDRVLLERFLEQHPEVASQDTCVIGLIKDEVRLRESLGEVLDPHEYARRFPTCGSQLSWLFEGRAAATSDGGPSSPQIADTDPDTVEYLDDEAANEQQGIDGFLSTIPHHSKAGNAKGLRFRLLRPHARGGLGEVFVAFDEELRREVALKQIQARHADNEDSRIRFVAEAEITGGLEHPGIVPVYGLGSYRDGRPFYAMRFIRGESLKSAIDRFHSTDIPGRDSGERSLELRKLLARMTDVCDAVEYAHSRGVLHRDLKPANIMLGKFGETLVVDWGLAKTIGGSTPTLAVERPLELSSRSGSGETKTGSAVGTPQYMSPEQASGRLDLLSTASDVYCLGSTLYHLLTGKPPLDSKDVSDVLSRVVSGNFRRPRAVNPQVPPALEAIALKAMALEPARRYATPRLLADDIEHWMADEPVTAYRESRAQRAGRWMRKHRTWTRAAVVTLFGLAIVSLVAALLVNQARRKESIERQNAQVARQQAVEGFRQARESADTWLTGASEVLRHYPHMQGIRQQLLKKAAADYEKFASEYNPDAGLEIERGRTQVRLGDVHRMLGDVEASMQAYQQAEQVFASLIEDGQLIAEAQVDRANARVKRGLLLADIGQAPAADKEYQAAVRELRAFETVEPLGSRGHEVLGAALLNRATLERSRGDYEAAIQSLEESLDVLSDTEQSPGPAPSVQFAAATARSLWGQCLSDTGKSAAAVAKFEQALQQYAALIALAPDNPDYVDFQAATRISMSSALRNIGRYGDELINLRSAVAAYEMLDRTLSDSPIYRERLALTRTDMAQLLHHLGQSPRARAELELALPVFQELQRTAPDVVRYREEEAAALDVLGQALSDLDENELARTAHQRAIAICENLVREVPDVLAYQERQAVSRSHLGQVLHKLGAHEEARTEFAAALAGLDGLSPQTPATIDAACFVRTHLGALLLDMNDQKAATESFARANADWEKLVTESASPEFQKNLAWLHVMCPDPAFRDSQKAEKLAEQAVQQSPENSVYLGTLAAAQYRRAEFPAAIATLERVKQLRGDYDGRQWFFLAMAQWKAGARDQAAEALRSGRQWARENMPGNAELARLEDEAARTFAGP